MYNRLQWGHDFSAVEIFSVGLITTLTPVASMGPRLFSRGNSGGRSHDQHSNDASMGPRLFSRGNVAAIIKVEEVA